MTNREQQPKPTFVRAGKVIDDVRAIAREHGYAIAVHGSLRRERDIDLLAAPWVKEAHAPSTLIRAIGKLPYLRFRRDFEDKPHGRTAATFIVTFRGRDCPAYVDLSIMPRSLRRLPG